MFKYCRFFEFIFLELLIAYISETEDKPNLCRYLHKRHAPTLELTFLYLVHKHWTKQCRTNEYNTLLTKRRQMELLCFLQLIFKNVKVLKHKICHSKCRNFPYCKYPNTSKQELTNVQIIETNKSSCH